VGNGADEALIKRCAFAGFGQYYFIYNESEIEEKVINCLTNTHMDYQVLTKLEVFDENGGSIPITFTPQRLLQGQVCEWSQLIDKGVTASMFRARIENFKTAESRKYGGTFKTVKSNALYCQAVKNKFKELKK
jgi:hypothetical protein